MKFLIINSLFHIISRSILNFCKKYTKVFKNKFTKNQQFFHAPSKNTSKNPINNHLRNFLEPTLPEKTGKKSVFRANEFFPLSRTEAKYEKRGKKLGDESEKHSPFGVRKLRFNSRVRHVISCTTRPSSNKLFRMTRIT